MTIILTQEESEKYFYNSLCNGLSYMGGHGLEFDFKDKDYNKAKKTLQAKLNKGEIPHEMLLSKGEKPSICREDVYMEILRNGGKLKFNDIEGDGEYTKEIGLQEVHDRVQKTDADWLIQMRDEQDDAVTADCIIQTVFFEKIIFG